jgi:HCOMODA/2-hydroxy-3-carboxy-muconic semialdehyde decarboxylase
MIEPTHDVARDLVLANRILANEGVLDGFGHVSARCPADDERYLLSRSRSPQLVSEDDICEFDLDSKPMRDFGKPYYVERVIHGCAYRARADVRAVCHLHATPVLPFASAGLAIVPVMHVGAVIGQEIPIWDARDEFGDTDMLVSTLDQGHSLARALGSHWTVLMRRHGAVVVGRSVREVVFRAVHLKLNAEVQLQAQALGTVSPLSDREIELSAEVNLKPSVQGRVWEYWVSRLPDTEPPRSREHGLKTPPPALARTIA